MIRGGPSPTVVTLFPDISAREDLLRLRQPYARIRNKECDSSGFRDRQVHETIRCDCASCCYCRVVSLLFTLHPCLSIAQQASLSLLLLFHLNRVESALLLLFGERESHDPRDKQAWWLRSVRVSHHQNKQHVRKRRFLS